MSEIDHSLDHDEAVALFRATIVGALATRELAHGELKAELRRLSQIRHRPPDAKVTRAFSVTTLERWLYAYRRGGIEALRPERRSDAGRARALDAEQRQMLIDIRSEYPTASVSLILRTLELARAIEPGTIAPQTVRRLYRQAGLPRHSRKSLDAGLEAERQRLRWQAPYVSALWHADVCHALKIERAGRKPLPALVHALLDDHSRYIVRLEVRSTEREQDMLEIFANALREHGVAPQQLYTDGGATYTGGVLPIVCERLGTHLLHPAPRDPQARGKGERLFRTAREQCIDHIRGAGSLHDVLVRLLAWRDQYHRTPHSSLMGRTPEQVWREGTQNLEYQRRPAVSEQQLADAYRLRDARRIRKDSTLSIDGATFEVDALWLAGKKVMLERSYLAPDETCVIFEGKRYPVFPVDAERNAHRQRRRPPDKQPTVSADPPPPNPADVALDHMLNRKPQKESL
jgi:transposase InsO family protein